MNITKIISKTFDSRLKQIDLYASQASEIQHRVLSRLVNQAAQTEWGKKYDYASIRSYEDFRNRLPIQTYEEIKPYVEACGRGNRICFGHRKYAGLPNHPERPMIKANSCLSAKKLWKTFTIEAVKMLRHSTSASIRTVTFSREKVDSGRQP